MRAVVALGRADSSGDRLSFKDIAANHDIPRDYLAKILRSLVDAGIVDSKRGANGGYRLARPASEVSFLEVIEAADSPVAVNLCTEHGTGCCRSGDCLMSGIWQRAEDAMRTVFAQTTLRDVLGASSHPLTLARLADNAAARANERSCANL